jgi:hypothetical protein
MFVEKNGIVRECTSDERSHPETPFAADQKIIHQSRAVTRRTYGEKN